MYVAVKLEGDVFLSLNAKEASGLATDRERQLPFLPPDELQNVSELLWCFLFNHSVFHEVVLGKILSCCKSVELHGSR